MVDFYDEMAALATELLGTEEFGEPLNIQRVTGETRDPITGVVTPGTDESYTPLGVILDYEQDEFDGERIQRGDRKLIIDNSTQPRLTDKPVIDGSEWNVISWTKTQPRESSVVAMYTIQVRN